MLALFLTETAAGSLLVLLLVPPRAAGPRFFRYIVAQTCALLILGAALPPGPAHQDPLRSVLLAAAAVLLMASAGLFHVARLGAGRALMAAALAPAQAAVLVDATALIPSGDASLLSRVLYPLDAVTAGLVPGCVLVAMILGHFYLNIPGLSIRHLQRLALAFLVVVAARAALLAFSVSLHSAALAPLVALLLGTGAGLPPAGGLDPFVLVFLLLHLVAGVLAPAVFGFMAWRTARISSTQSATGILYVALIVVIMGELAGRYLVTTTKLPL